MSNIQTIKDNIKTVLDSLVTDGTLKAADEMDIRKDPLDGAIDGTPHAYLMPPSIESDTVDNRTVLRKYSFARMVVENAENVNGTSQVEQLIEKMLNKFDNAPTLSGAADGGVSPASSSPTPYQHNSKNLIVFFITIVVQSTQSLTY